MRHAASGLFADLHATPTGFGANTAMFVHAGVALAFLAAEPTRGGTGVEHAPDDFFIRPGASCRDASGDVADVGAIQIHAYALYQVAHLGFRKAGIGTGCACLSASVAFLDATDQCIIGVSTHVRVGAEHLLRLHGHSPERERWSSMQQSTEGSNMRPDYFHGGKGSVENQIGKYRRFQQPSSGVGRWQFHPTSSPPISRLQDLASDNGARRQ
jgi:hypothetical protein